MLPRLSTKVHPSGSLSTTAEVLRVEDKGEAYNCIPSPAPRPIDSNLKSSRWVCNYPRMSFMILFIVCTYIGGIYVSTEITACVLDMLGARKELADARQVYGATSHMLNSMTQCVDQRSLEYLAGAKLHFEADSKRIQAIINANDRVLADQRNATMTCSNAFLMTLQEQVEAAASDETQSTLDCFSDHFYETVPETNALSSSRTLILAVRGMLTAVVVSEANNSISEQTTQLENQLLEMWKAVDNVKASIENTFNATYALTSQQLSPMVPILSDKDGSDHTQQSASRLGRLGKVVSLELAGPLTISSATSLGAIRKAGRTFHNALTVLTGLHDGFTDVLDTVDETWEFLEHQLNATVQQATQLQNELLYAAKSTAQQLNSTSTAVLTSLDQARQEVSISFDILGDQWRLAMKKLVAQSSTSWRKLGDRLVAELTANERQNVRPKSSIQRKYLLPDRTTNSSLDKEHQKQTTASRDQGSRSTESSPDEDSKFDIDTAVLRAAVVDVSAFITQVLFYIDVGRLALLVTDLAVGLVTESYSDLPMLDIRGITTVDTIESIGEVLLCQHSFSVICYTIVTKASEVLRDLVTFLVLFVGTVAITAGLFLWKKDHNIHCQSGGSSVTASQTAIQSVTRAYFDYNGNSSKRVVNPLDEIQKRATVINDSIRNDYAALSFDLSIVWKNQSIALDDLNDCATTTSSMTRMLQDCVVSAEGAVAAAAAPSLSSQCLASSLNSIAAPENPLPFTKQLSVDAPFLAPSTSFDSCFPKDDLLGREELVGNLQHSLACATEKAVYLSCASWWLLVVVFVANRFAVRMIIKAAGMYWWRFLSAGRLQFVGFCHEDGDIVASGKLPTAVQNHLRDTKWQIVSRFVAIGFAYACVVTIIVIVVIDVT